MKCECGFNFTGKGEYRKTEEFLTLTGKIGIICPVCRNAYVNGNKVELKKPEIDMD